MPDCCVVARDGWNGEVLERYWCETRRRLWQRYPPAWPAETGKTMLVRALANELDHTSIPVNTPALQSGRGGPAQRIPMLFHRAQRNAPVILFFDGQHAVNRTRRRPTTR